MLFVTSLNVLTLNKKWIEKQNWIRYPHGWNKGACDKAEQWCHGSVKIVGELYLCNGRLMWMWNKNQIYMSRHWHQDIDTDLPIVITIDE